MEEFLKNANITQEQLEALISEWDARGVEDSFEIPNSNGITFGDLKKIARLTPVEEVMVENQTEEEVSEQLKNFKKMSHRELFTNYAMILVKMSDILGIPKYVGIENEDPYSIHYNLSAEDRELFIELQGKISDIKTIEPKMENEYVEITDRIKATRAEMGKLLREEPHPGIEDTPVDTKLNGEELIRFQELRNRLLEMKRDYPVLFVNELKYDMSEDRTTTKPQPADVEAQKTIDEELFSMGDADLDAQIARLMKEKDRRAAERRIENLKDESKNPYKDISTEELEEKLKDYYVYSEGESMQDDPNTLEYEAILNEINRRKEAEVVNPYQGMSDEQLHDRLVELSSYSEGEDMSNDPANKEYQEILDELDRRKQEEKTEEKQPVEQPDSLYSLKHDEIIQDDLSIDNIDQDFGTGMTDEEIEAARKNLESAPAPVETQPQVDVPTNEEEPILHDISPIVANAQATRENDEIRRSGKTIVEILPGMSIHDAANAMAGKNYVGNFNNFEIDGSKYSSPEQIVDAYMKHIEEHKTKSTSEVVPETKEELVENKQEVVEQQNVEYIPGTNIPKPRNRDTYETDEEYNKFLEGYYAQYFPNKEQNNVEAKEQQPVEEQTKEEDFQAPAVIEQQAKNTADAADIAFNRDIQQNNNPMNDDFQAPAVINQQATNDFQAPAVTTPVHGDDNIIDGEYREVPQAARVSKLKKKAARNLAKTNAFMVKHGKLTTAAGFILGLSVGTLGVNTGLLLVPKAVELGTKAVTTPIKAWTKKHPSGKIARMGKFVKNHSPEFAKKVASKIKNIQEKAKNSALRPLINGFSAGYAVTYIPQYFDGLSSGIEHVTGLSR